MNTIPLNDNLVGDLPHHNINFPVPDGLIHVNPSNLDIGKFYYQCWLDIDGDFPQISWYVVQIKEGTSSDTIYTERHRFFLSEADEADIVGWSTVDDVGLTQIGNISQHMKIAALELNDEIPEGVSCEYFRYFVPASA
jgi:hypothetical protein